MADDGAGGPDGGLVAANALNTSQSVLQYFWDLASYDEDVRLSAARRLASDLASDQSKHLATLKKDTDKQPEDGAPTIQQLEYHLRRCSPTLVYALRRLGRGLASSRQGARQGYATALAGVLAAVGGSKGPAAGGLSAQGVLVLLEVCLDGPTRGGDAKDTLLGKLFGLGALLRSGLHMDQATSVQVFGQLLEVGSRKSFLREAAAATAMEAASHMDKAAVAAATAPGQPLAAMLAAPPAEATPEALLLALVLWPKLPPAVVKSCRLLPQGTPPPPPELFTSSSAPSAATAAAAAATAAGLFAPGHVKQLQPVLLATSASHPRMHTLWRYLLPLLLPGFVPYRHVDAELVAADRNGQAAAGGEEAAAAGAGAGGKGGKKGKKDGKDAGAAAGGKGLAKDASKGAVSGALLEAFWGSVVEGGLMDSSHERRYLGFQLFGRLLPHLRAEHVQVVFSPNFTRTLMNNVRRGDSYLHASAKKLMDGISSFLERASAAGGADEDAKLAVAAALQRLGGMAPRELAAGKLTHKLVQGMDAGGVHRYVGSLMEAFLGARQPGQLAGAGAAAKGAEQEEEEEEGEQAAADRRAQCVEQLLTVLKFPAAAEQDGAAALRFLATHAFVDAQANKAKAAKSKLPELQTAAAHLTAPLAPATRTLCAARLVTLLSHLSHLAQARARTAQQQQSQGGAGKEAKEDAAQGQGQGGPAAKKRKTAEGAAAAANGEGAVALPPPSAVHQHLHDTLAFIRGVREAPGAAPALELEEEAEAALGMLAAIETAALERLAVLDGDKQPPAAAAAEEGAKGGKKGAKGKAGKGAAEQEEEGGPGGQQAPALRACAALAAQLQLQLLAEPEGFELDLPMSLRKVAAEGLGLRGLPEVEVVEGDEEAEGGEAGPGPWSDVLVDVMLALLARPGGALPVAPLREAAEALWRQCCERVGAAGLEDVVRVVAAGDKSDKDAAGLFESDDEDEEEEEEQLGGSDDEDEEGSGSEEEEEAGGRAGKGKGAKPQQGRKGQKRKQAGGSEDDEDEGGDASGSGDESDESDEGMDDEAMFRMDEKLASYFRTMVGGKAGGQAAAERAAALLNFRLRALTLVEMYAKKLPSSPLLLGCLVPLLRALAVASRPGGQQALAERLRGVLLHKLCKARCAVEPASMGGLEGYSAAAKRLLYEASRNRDKGVAAVALHAYTALVRAGQASADAAVSEAARASFRTALTDMLTKKKTRLTLDGLASAFRTAPAAALPALDLLLAHVATGRNAHVRISAAELLARVVKERPEGLAAALGGAPAKDGKKGAAAEGKGAVTHGSALGAALAACAAGVGLKREHHARAAKAAASVAEGLKRLLPDKRAGEVLGPEKVNAIAKAVVTVESLGAPPKVLKPLRRMGDQLGLGPLLDKTQPDPALASRIQKATPAQQQAADAAKAKAAEAAQANGGPGKKDAKAGDKGKKKGAAKAGSEEEEGQSEGVSGEEEEGSDGGAGGSSDGEGDEEMGGSDEPGSSSGGGDDDDGDSDSEGGESSDEEEGRGGGGRGKRGRGGRGGGGRGRGGPGRGGRGGGGRGGGGRGRGGPAAKKARR